MQPSEVNPENLATLRTQLLALGRTEGQIKQLRDHATEGSSTTEYSIIEVLELWQQIFKDTFQQYQRLSTRLVQTQDSATALRLWREYLQHVQAFLANGLPDDYSSLNEHRHLCEVHQNLLTSQQSVLALKTGDGSKNVDPVLVQEFNTLSNLHNNTLSSIIDRHKEIQLRLAAWEKYRIDQARLLEWLKNQERERSRLQLRYIHLRRVPHVLHNIDTLLKQIPQGEKECDSLRGQQAQLSHFCNDALVASMRMEHSAIAQRVGNLRAALQTWKDFLTNILNKSRIYNEKVKDLQNQFEDIQQVITTTSTDLPNTVEQIDNCLAELRRQRLRIHGLTPDLEAISVIQEELKECVSPADMKTISQMVWILWQQEADLDQQLSSLINQIEERLSLNAIFLAKYERLMQWMDSVEERLDNESHSVLRDPEELIRRLEKDLQSEISLREREKEWLLSSARELLTFYAGDSENDREHRTEIQKKSDSIVDRWERLRILCKSRSNKIHDLKVTMLRLEERIAAIRAWLYTMEVDLSKPLVFASADNSAFDNVIQEHDKLQRAIEKESSNVGEVLNLSEMLLSDVDTWKAHFKTSTLTAAVENLERRWKNVCNLSAERKRRIHTIWSLLQEVWTLTRQQELWVITQEKDLESLQGNTENLTKNQVEDRIEVLEQKIREIESKAPIFKVFKHSYSKLLKTKGLEPENVQKLTSDAKDVLNRYDALVSKALDIIGKLSKDMRDYREFVNTHGKAIVTLTQIDAELTKLQHLPKETSKPEDQLNSLHVLEQELKLCEADLANADQLGLVLMKKAKPEDIDSIQILIDEYQLLWKDITERILLLKTELSKKINENIQRKTVKYETEVAVQVNTLPKLNRTTSITAKDAYIYELEAALKECNTNLDQLEKEVNDPKRKPGSQVVSKAISAAQSSVELLNHLSTILITECFCTDEEAHVIDVAEISARYETLVSLWKAKERQYQQSRYVSISDNIVFSLVWILVFLIFYTLLIFFLIGSGFPLSS